MLDGACDLAGIPGLSDARAEIGMDMAYFSISSVWTQELKPAAAGESDYSYNAITAGRWLGREPAAYEAT